MGFSADPTYVRKAFEKSVKRLGVDYVDLYYAHRYVMLNSKPVKLIHIAC